MNMFNLVKAKQIILHDDNISKDFSKYIPYSVKFTVGEMSSTVTYRDLTINIKNMTGINYAAFPYVQNAVARTTPYWLTFQIWEKNPTTVRVRFYNEQYSESIKASEWAILIVPYM